MPSPIITKYKGDYPTCIGVEYALVPKGLNPSLGVDSFGFSALGSKLSNTVSQIDKRFSKTKSWAKYIWASPSSNDSGGKHELGSVEYSSTPCKSLGEVTEFYKYAGKLFQYGEKVSGLKFVANTTSKGVYIEGGGGHLHLNARISETNEPLNVKFRWNMAIFLLNNPIIQWCCSEWCDDDTLNSTYYNALQKELKCEINKFSTPLLVGHLDFYASDWGRAPLQIRVFDHNSTKKSLPTVEFRCLAAPTSFQHLVDNIDLCISIWEYVKSETEYSESSFPLKFENVEAIRKYTKKVDFECEWKSLITTLGLNWERYKPYMKNLHARKTHGRLYSKTFCGLE
jgi:hypothetical protein